ncbi:MAG: SET domain-containing protein-lysine N-methyltransferase [Planctomycetia bacterium]|nr:SET domain-containing protein-lysine N-methyltransferase [Planctomycetia bacterium]
MRKDSLSRSRLRHTKLLKEGVRVGRSPTGSGVFANRRYREHDLIGEIVGQVINDPAYGSDYCFELDAGRLIEPVSPFRFINHSCNPNCEFDYSDQPVKESLARDTRLFLFAARSIKANDQLTIDYNWPVEAAIPCQCGASNCRGWIVASEELGKLGDGSEDGSTLALQFASVEIQ